jgi:hypothetical protein
MAGETSSGTQKSPLDGIKISALGYFDYSNGESALPSDSSKDYNYFKLTRGYLTVTKELNDWLSVRSTLDLTQESGGDYKIRQKYIYANIKPKDAGFLTNMNMEIGMGHIPWLDFEEHINPYRCQGTMAVERAGVFNSADLGIGLYGYFGGKLENAREKTGNSFYDGLYGSWHLGVYNGSGYHAVEANENKAAEMRATIRPLPLLVPGLQVSYFGVFAKGNIAKSPDYNVRLGMISYEHPFAAITAQYFTTDGNAKGTWIDSTDKALKTEGYSIFGNFKIGGKNVPLSLFGRYDFFDTDADHMVAEKTAYNMIVAGLSYDLHKGNLIMLTFEITDYEEDAGEKGKLPETGNNLGDDQKMQLVYQIKF